MAQIILSTRHLVKVLPGIQQKFYQTSSRAIFLLLDVQQIFTPSKRCLVGSYFSATRCLVENFYQTSSRAEDLGQYTCVCIIVLTSAFLKQTFPLFTPSRSQIDGKLFLKLSNLLPNHNFDQQNPSIWLVGVLLNTGRD